MNPILFRHRRKKSPAGRCVAEFAKNSDFIAFAVGTFGKSRYFFAAFAIGIFRKFRYFSSMNGKPWEEHSYLKRKLQKQGHDHVLREESRRQSVFQTVAGYVRENPLRAGLVEQGNLPEYRWSGCLVPGFPELDVWSDDFWDSYWKIYWRLRDGK